jgi:DNA-binding NarL/FixJ family response regulator
MSSVSLTTTAVPVAGELALLRTRLAESEAARRALARRLAALEQSHPLTNLLRRLTATEFRIAELASTGATNREISRAVFLSEKTIEWNLSKVYRKLHVRSRTELAAKMIRNAAGSPSNSRHEHKSTVAAQTRKFRRG